MPEYVDEFSEVIHSDFLQMEPFLVRRCSTVFLTSEQVERVFSAEKRVVVNYLYRGHPVWSEVACNLNFTMTRQLHNTAM